MNRSVIALVGVCISAFGLPTHATLLTVRASDYAVGTETTHALAGVTIRGIDGGYDNPGLNYYSTYVVPIINNGSDTGLRTFNGLQTPDRIIYPFNYKSAQLSTYWSPYGAECSECDAILFDLDQPTDYVKIMGGTTGDPAPNDSMFAAAFDADWNLIDTCYSSHMGSCTTFGTSLQRKYWNVDLEFSTASPAISHIVAGGQTIGWVGGLTYNRAVPEPAALGLLFLGLIGAALRFGGAAIAGHDRHPHQYPQAS